jgi:fructoselysine-6-P-deglycase FrlB-like protein
VTFNPDSDLKREVAGQPDDWAGVVARLPELADALPAAGARVAVVGCGTSYFMAQAYARAASSPVTARPTRSRPASTGSTAATTPCW